MTDEPMVATRIRVARYRRARVDHHFLRDGRVRRFVVLESKALRAALDKPRRSEIDPLKPNGNGDVSNGALWEMAERTAMELLRGVYETARAKRCNGHARHEPNHALGEPLVPQVSQAGARGVLLYAGVRPGVAYCIELHTPDGEVRRIEGLELRRAMALADVRVGDAVRVTVPGDAQRTGSHGNGKHRLPTRRVFEITKEVMHEQTDDHRKHRQRSGVGVSANQWNARRKSSDRHDRALQGSAVR